MHVPLVAFLSPANVKTVSHAKSRVPMLCVSCLLRKEISLLTFDASLEIQILFSCCYSIAHRSHQLYFILGIAKFTCPIRAIENNNLMLSNVVKII